uniref:Putative exopolygalacturonase-like n=1 Tax=Davidia involucrata TaxID=16924 RepID=A0A5B7C3U1_DAVIN
MAMAKSRASAIGVLVLCFALVSCEAKGLAVPVGETIFNVLQFGARPGGKQESTQAFMRAWIAACKNFDGVRAKVLIPPGIYKLSETIFGGPCKSRNPITVQLAGTLIANTDLSEYSGKSWISFSKVDGLLLTGGGTIDARGQDVWKYNDCKSNPSCVHLPSTLYFTNVRNAVTKGISLLNSMGFHMHITNSYNVRFQRLRISAPPDSPNTDGMHISKSLTVKVSRSVISTGDDCISVGQGSTNVTINKVTCGPGHGISVGSLGKLPNELDVRGLIVKNCTILGTTNGVRIKTWPGSGPSQASGLLFSNIIMDNVQNPIIVDQGYGGKSNKQPSRVKISHVIYQNIMGTTVSPVAVNLMCSKQVPCQNVRLSNIKLRSSKNMPLTATCTNAQVGYSGIQNPPPCK